MANTANYFDMPIVIDAVCAAIALTMRQTAKVQHTIQPSTITQRQDKQLRNTHADCYDQSYQFVETL